MKRKLLLASIILGAILILPGCGKNKTDSTSTNSNNQATTTTITTSTKVIKMPDTETKPEYTYCESRDYELIIRFDKETQKSKAYCRFPDTTECEAISFMRGECTLGNNSSSYQITTVKEPVKTIRECPKNYDPVCGENGATFTNECIATSQNVKIVSSGACQPKDDSNINNITINPNSTSKVDYSSIPYWLPTITDMFLLEPKSTPAAYIEKCIFNDKIVYYASYGCANCEDMLYDEDAKLICYPNKDLNKDCPDYFNLNTKKSFCKRIWTDTR